MRRWGQAHRQQFPLSFLAGGPPSGYLLPRTAGLQAQAVSPPRLQDRASTDAEGAAAAPVHRAKTAKQACWCLRAQWYQPPVKHHIAMGQSLDMCELTRVPPCASLPLQKTSGYLINPVLYHRCCCGCLGLRPARKHRSLLLAAPACTHAPQPPEPTAVGLPAPTARPGSCSRPVAGVAIPTHHPAFSKPCFSQPILSLSFSSLRSHRSISPWHLCT